MRHPNQIVIYTCVVNGYDRLRQVDSRNIGWDFICFTDRPEKVPAGWRAASLQSPPRLQNGHDINRFHKLFPHRLFSKYRYSIYIDGNREYTGNYDDLLECFQKSNAAVGAFRHPNKRNLISEAEACKKYRKFDEYDLTRVQEQLETYTKYGFDLDSAISANYFLIRDHSHPNIHAAMSMCWSHLFEFSKRDQMSFNFSLWKENAPFIFLDDCEGVNATMLLGHSHRASLFEKCMHSVRRAISKFLKPLVK